MTFLPGTEAKSGHSHSQPKDWDHTRFPYPKPRDIYSSSHLPCCIAHAQVWLKKLIPIVGFTVSGMVPTWTPRQQLFLEAGSL